MDKEELIITVKIFYMMQGRKLKEDMGQDKVGCGASVTHPVGEGLCHRSLQIPGFQWKFVGGEHEHLQISAPKNMEFPLWVGH